MGENLDRIQTIAADRDHSPPPPYSPPLASHDSIGAFADASTRLYPNLSGFENSLSPQQQQQQQEISIGGSGASTGGGSGERITSFRHNRHARREARRQQKQQSQQQAQQQAQQQSQQQAQQQSQQQAQQQAQQSQQSQQSQQQSLQQQPDPSQYELVASLVSAPSGDSFDGESQQSRRSSSRRHHRHHRHHHHHHHHPNHYHPHHNGTGKVLLKYLRTVAKNSLNNLYDELTAPLPPPPPPVTSSSNMASSWHSATRNDHNDHNNQRSNMSGSYSAARVGTGAHHHHPHHATSPVGSEMHEFISAREALENDPIFAATSQQHQSANAPIYNPYAPPPPRNNLFPLTDILQDPINAGLSTLNRVTQIVRSPTTQIISGASAAYNIANHIFTPRPPGNAERVVNSTGYSNGNSSQQSEFVTLAGDRKSSADSSQANGNDCAEGFPLPPPVLPLIECSIPQNRLDPLTEQEFAMKADGWTAQELCIRVFKGGIAEDNKLRCKIWPIILRLTEEVSIEFDWSKLNDLYRRYRSQWEAILPEQEKRFSLFRERKSLIERDVIRIDRTHPYYQGESENLDRLKQMLLTYSMYDFDTGYVQGMSDLASPLLYVADGDVAKSFWFFAQMMDFTHNNFEMSQLTIKLQLDMLWKLIELTDPIFAQYLANNDSVNCYFAFRWIVCQFKREFMKSNLDDYQDVLLLWESIWTCSAMRRHWTEMRDDEQKRAKREEQISDEERKKKKKKMGEEEEMGQLKPESKPVEETSVSSAPSDPRISGSEFSLKQLEQKQKEADNNLLLESRFEESCKIVPQTEHHEHGGGGGDDDCPATSSTPSSASEWEANAATAATKTASPSPSPSPSPSISPSPSSGNNQNNQNNQNNLYIPQVKRLSDSELYVLCICLCIIRRERDLIMVNRFDATDILKHFNTLQLNANLKDILIHAANIWCWLVYDGKEALLYAANRGDARSAPGVDRSSCSTASNCSPVVEGVTTTTSLPLNSACSIGGEASSTGNTATITTTNGNNTTTPTTRNDADDFDLLIDARLPASLTEDYFLFN